MTSNMVNDIGSFFQVMENRLDSNLSGKSQDDSFSKIIGGYTDSKTATPGQTGEEKQKPGQMQAARISRDTVKSSEVKPSKKKITGDDSQKSSSDSVNESKSKDAPKTDKDMSDKAAADIKDKCNEVKDSIKEELDVTDEQIELAMQELGFGIQDLLNTDNVKELMMNLTGTKNPLELITNEDLLGSINNVLNQVTEAVTEIKSDFNLSDEDFGRLLDEGFENPEDVDKSEIAPMSISGISDTGLDRTEVPYEGERKAEDNSQKRIKVEINDSRTEGEKAPEVKINGFENPKMNQDRGSQNQNQNTDNSFAQTIVTTEVNSVGDVVETVRSFAGEFSSANEIMNQVTEHIKVNLSPENTSMEMQLHPASLGTVTLQIGSQNGIVTAHLTVQNESVRDALAAQMSELQKTFEEQGQKVESIEVTVADYNLDNGMQQSNEQGKQGSSSNRARRTLNLNELSEDMMEELDEEEKLQASVMAMNGNSVEYRA